MMVSSLLLVALVVGAGAALWIYLHQPEQGQARAADEKTLSEKTPTIDVSGLPASRIAVVDIGAITVAWGTGGGTDASAVALKLRQTFDRLAQSGVVVVESRYSLASPPSVDITAQVAASVGVDLKALLAVPATAYSNPVTPTMVEGTGWRVGAPPAAHAPTPGAPVATRNANPSATKKTDANSASNPDDD